MDIEVEFLKNPNPLIFSIFSAQKFKTKNPGGYDSLLSGGLSEVVLSVWDIYTRWRAFHLLIISHPNIYCPTAPQLAYGRLSALRMFATSSPEFKLPGLLQQHMCLEQLLWGRCSANSCCHCWPNSQRPITACPSTSSVSVQVLYPADSVWLGATGKCRERQYDQDDELPIVG